MCIGSLRAAAAKLFPGAATKQAKGNPNPNPEPNPNPDPNPNQAGKAVTVLTYLHGVRECENIIAEIQAPTPTLPPNPQLPTLTLTPTLTLSQP